MLHELERFIRKLNPFVYLVTGVVQKLLKALFFFLGIFHASLEILFVKFLPGPHIYEAVYYRHAIFVIFLQVCENRVGVYRVLGVLFAHPFHAKVVDFLRNIQLFQNINNLIFQLVSVYNALAALGPAFSFGAVIIGVVVDIAVFLALDFIFGCYHTSALAASDHTGKWKNVRVRSFVFRSAQHFLHFPEFLFGNHWLVPASEPVARSFREFKHAVVERVSEHHIRRAVSHRFSADAPVLWR